MSMPSNRKGGLMGPPMAPKGLGGTHKAMLQQNHVPGPGWPVQAFEKSKIQCILVQNGLTPKPI